MKKMLFVISVVALNICALSYASYSQTTKAKTTAKPKTTVGTGTSKPVTLSTNVVPADVPDELKNCYLRRGNTSALRYYNDKANTSRASQESLQEYKLAANGDVEYVQALSLHFDGDCSNMTFSYFKGRMIFNQKEQSVEWIPTSASFRQKFCTGTPTDRKGSVKDMERSKAKYYYKFNTEFEGKTYLMLYEDAAMENGWVGSYLVIPYDPTKE